MNKFSLKPEVYKFLFFWTWSSVVKSIIIICLVHNFRFTTTFSHPFQSISSALAIKLWTSSAKIASVSRRAEAGACVDLNNTRRFLTARAPGISTKEKKKPCQFGSKIWDNKTYFGVNSKVKELFFFWWKVFALCHIAYSWWRWNYTIRNFPKIHLSSPFWDITFIIVTFIEFWHAAAAANVCEGMLSRKLCDSLISLKKIIIK